MLLENKVAVIYGAGGPIGGAVRRAMDGTAQCDRGRGVHPRESEEPVTERKRLAGNLERRNTPRDAPIMADHGRAITAGGDGGGVVGAVQHPAALAVLGGYLQGVHRVARDTKSTDFAFCLGFGHSIHIWFQRFVPVGRHHAMQKQQVDIVSIQFFEEAVDCHKRLFFFIGD